MYIFCLWEASTENGAGAGGAQEMLSAHLLMELPWPCPCWQVSDVQHSRGEAQRLVALLSCSICVWKAMLQHAWAVKTQASATSSSVSEALVKRGTALCLIDKGIYFRAGNANIHKPLDPGTSCVGLNLHAGFSSLRGSWQTAWFMRHCTTSHTELSYCRCHESEFCQQHKLW